MIKYDNITDLKILKAYLADGEQDQELLEINLIYLGVRQKTVGGWLMDFTDDDEIKIGVQARSELFDYQTLRKSVNGDYWRVVGRVVRVRDNAFKIVADSVEWLGNQATSIPVNIVRWKGA